ncbi:MAG: MarC family protein [Candidatus Micrarchaeia archaeon]
MLHEFAKALAMLFIIMDPFASLPVFVAITKGKTADERVGAANTATMSAAIAVISFILFGPELLGVMGIAIESFQIAGGLLLLLIAIQFTLGAEFGKYDEVDTAIVIIGVPLISGPGALTTAIVLAGKYGKPITFIAATVALLLTYAILRKGSEIHRFLGMQGLEIFSRMMGVLLAALAVEFIRMGLGI